MVDPSGAETTALATARDFARFGQLICDGGRVDNRQVVPTDAIKAVFVGGNIDAFAAGDRKLPGVWSYRSQWWYRHLGDRVCPAARGAQGQLLYIDPLNELVIARYASPRMLPPEMFDNLWWPIVDTIIVESDLTQRCRVGAERRLALSGLVRLVSLDPLQSKVGFVEKTNRVR
jgi:CubicO group peptidase (beta-lactamase class C family)